MSRPKSTALIQAMQLVADGHTMYRASQITGVNRQVIGRAIKPPIKPKCPCCGKTLTGAKK